MGSPHRARAKSKPASLLPKSQFEQHRALVPHANARALTVILDFRHKTQTTLYNYSEDETACWFDEKFLEILPRYAPTIAKVDVLITYQHSQAESNRGIEAGRVLKQHQGDIVKRVAMELNNFKELKELEIKVKMPSFAWGQVKNVAHFYQLNLTNWKLWQALGEVEMTEVKIGSTLEERIAGFAGYLKRCNEL